MANNNGSNNNNRGGKNGKGNFRGVLTLIAWALVLTVAFNYFSAYNRNTANKSTSHEIKYSEMIEMVEKNQVEEILFKDSTIYVTPVEGYVYTEEVTTGGKASETLQRTLSDAAGMEVEQPEIGGFTTLVAYGRTLQWWRMPSTSRAYPLKLEKKAEYYARLFPQSPYGLLS